MDTIIIIGTATMIILAFTLELANIAESASDKAIGFSNEMDNAIPCAIQGLSIYECSPNLAPENYNWEQDAQDFKDYVEEHLDEIEEEINSATSLTTIEP